MTGDLTGDVTGNVTGDLTGDVTGNVTGDVTGGTISGTFTGDGSAITGVMVPADNVTPGIFGTDPGSTLYQVYGHMFPDNGGIITANDIVAGTYDIEVADMVYTTLPDGSGGQTVQQLEGIYDITVANANYQPILTLDNNQGSLIRGENNSDGSYAIHVNVNTETGQGFYVNNANSNAIGTGFMVDYAGKGTPVYVNRFSASPIDTDEPAVAIYNNSNGAALSPANQMGANLYIENNATSSKSTAIKVEQGRTMLAYADASTGDLSDLGYASVINVDDGSGTPVTITDLPTDGDNGQVLYVTFEDGGTYDTYTVAAGEGLKFVYANGWKVIR